MSRLAAKSIMLPVGLLCSVEGDHISLKKGESNITIPFKSHYITVKMDSSSISLFQKEGTKTLASLKGVLGTTWALLKNGIRNLQNGCQIPINFIGVGYRASVIKAGQFSYLKISVGFSHSIFIFIPPQITIKMEKETAIISGPTQKIVSDFCALVRNEKKPTIYHGTGILVNGETVNKKAGKKK